MKIDSWLEGEPNKVNGKEYGWVSGFVDNVFQDACGLCFEWDTGKVVTGWANFFDYALIEAVIGMEVHEATDFLENVLLLEPDIDEMD